MSIRCILFSPWDWDQIVIKLGTKISKPYVEKEYLC